MRALNKEEARLLFSKLVKYQGERIQEFLQKNFNNNFVFRLQKNRIFFCSFFLSSRVLHFFKKNLGSFGICIGRFTSTKKFQFLIPFLDLMVKHKKFHSLITNLAGEKNFTHGLQLTQEKILKISKFLLRSDGIIIFGPTNIPIGFGEILKSIFFILKIKKKKKEVITTNHGDIGCYIRVL